MIVLMSSVAFGGAWTRDLGSAYVKASADIYQAISFQAPGESQRSDGNYFGQQYSVYAETGLSPGHPIQLSIAAPLTVGSHRTEVFDPFGSLPVRATTIRMGDFRAWLQTALSRKLPLAAGVELKIPMYANGGVGTSIRNFRDLFPKPGDGQVDVTAWLHGGHAIGNTFVEGGLGYIFRTEAFVGWDTAITFNDGWRVLAKVGHTFDKVLVVGGLDGQFVFSGRAPDGDVDLFTRRFLVAFASGLFDIGDTGLAIEPRLAYELYAQNASQGWGGGIGISWRN